MVVQITDRDHRNEGRPSFQERPPLERRFVIVGDSHVLYIKKETPKSYLQQVLWFVKIWELLCDVIDSKRGQRPVNE